MSTEIVGDRQADAQTEPVGILDRVNQLLTDRGIAMTVEIGVVRWLVNTV